MTQQTPGPRVPQNPYANPGSGDYPLPVPPTPQNPYAANQYQVPAPTGSFAPTYGNQFPNAGLPLQYPEYGPGVPQGPIADNQQVGYVYPTRPSRRQAIGTSSSMVVVGVVALIVAAASLTSFLLSRTMPASALVPPRMFLVGVGLSFVVVGAVLAYTSVKGRTGGWLTTVSIVASAFLLPISLAIGGFLGSEQSGIASPQTNWNSGTTSQNDDDDDAEDGGGDDSGATPAPAPQPTSYVDGQTEFFDHETRDIYSRDATVTLDLTNAPDGASAYIYVNLKNSELFIDLRADQAVSFFAPNFKESEFSIEASETTLSAYPWLENINSVGDSKYIDSDAFVSDGYRGTSVDISTENSTITFRIVDDEEPQS